MGLGPLGLLRVGIRMRRTRCLLLEMRGFILFSRFGSQPRNFLVSSTATPPPQSSFQLRTDAVCAPVGTGIKLYGHSGSGGASLWLRVDGLGLQGKLWEVIDLSTQSQGVHVPIFEVSGLSDGDHEVLGWAMERSGKETKKEKKRWNPR